MKEDGKEKRRGRQAEQRSKEARNQQGKNRDKNINPSVFKQHFWVILLHLFCKISKFWNGMMVMVAQQCCF